MKSYDVIIIGAGPAGLECANILQHSNLSILLLERNSVIGPKPCGGGVTTAEKIVDAPDSICKIITKETFYLGENRWIADLKHIRKVFDRKDYGQYQLGKIKKDSIDIKTGATILSIGENAINTTIGDFSYKYLVGADGSSSIVRKHLGLPIKFCQGLYYEIPGQFDELVSYLNPKTISSGYIWEFPHKTHNNVGIYFDPDYLKTTDAKRILDEYMQKRGYEITTSKYFASIINYLFKGYKFGNIFLAGDAGGFASRLHGGGINNAMISGRDIANLIINKDYIPKGIEAVLRDKHKEDRLLNIFYNNKWLQYPALRFLLTLQRLKIL